MEKKGLDIPIGDIGSVRYIASYITIAGELVVIVEVTSAIDGLMLPYDAAYLATNNRQVEVTYYEGSSELDSGRVGNVAYYFTGTSFGGTLELTFTDSEWNEVPIYIATQ